MEQPEMKDSEGKRLPETECPKCGDKHDCATDVNLHGLERPRPGDVTICISCGTVNVFNEDMTVREAELNDMMKMRECDLAIMTKIQDHIRNREWIKHNGPGKEKK